LMFCFPPLPFPLYPSINLMIAHGSILFIGSLQMPSLLYCYFPSPCRDFLVREGELLPAKRRILILNSDADVRPLLISPWPCKHMKLRFPHTHWALKSLYDILSPTQLLGERGLRDPCRNSMPRKRSETRECAIRKEQWSGYITLIPTRDVPEVSGRAIGVPPGCRDGVSEH